MPSLQQRVHVARTLEDYKDLHRSDLCMCVYVCMYVSLEDYKDLHRSDLCMCMHVCMYVCITGRLQGSAQV